MNILKKKPIRIIYGSSLFVFLYMMLMNIINRIDMIYYILSSVITSLIVIYAIYARINFEYEKVYTKFKLLKYRFDIVNGYLIEKFLFYIITCASLLLINMNPFQNQGFDFTSIIFIVVMAICLLMFVKISSIRPNRNNPDNSNGSN